MNSHFVATFVFPLALAAAGLFGGGARRLASAFTPLAAVPALLTALLAPDLELVLDDVLVVAHFRLDAVTRPFLLLAATVWTAAGVFARGYMAGDARRGSFDVFFLAAMAGSLGLVIATDAASFYLLFALMTFSAWGLVAHDRTEAARRAARVYLVLGVVGEAALFAGIVFAAGAADSWDIDAIHAAPLGPVATGMLLFGLGIKAGIVPLHFWLPLAHPAAPTPASAALSGVMIKAGILGWLKLLPFGNVAAPQWATAIIVVGFATVFFGILVGLAQGEAKTILAYSSISQMGLLTAAAGLGLLHPSAWPASLAAVSVGAVHHGLAKAALFLGVGVVRAADARRKRLIVGLLLVPALALAGAPLTTGAIAKGALKAALKSASAPMPDLLAALIPLGAVGTSLLMARYLSSLHRERDGHGRAGAGIWAPWLALLAVVAAGPVLLFDPGGLLQLDEVWSGLWPIAVGAAVAVAWVRLAPGAWRRASLPPGDVVVPVERATAWSVRVARASDAARNRLDAALHAALARMSVDIPAALAPAEARLVRWEVATVAFLSVVVLVAALLRLG